MLGYRPPHDCLDSPGGTGDQCQVCVSQHRDHGAPLAPGDHVQHVEHDVVGTEAAVELDTGTEHVQEEAGTDHVSVQVWHGAAHDVQMVSPVVQLLLLGAGCRL